MKLNSKINKIWFTSDTHYWHKNLVYGESVWKDKSGATRKFDTTQEMSRYMVKKINQCVEEDDILFHLGDWSFGGIDNIWNFRKQLRVKKIHFIIGNHDHHIKNNVILSNVHRLEPYSQVILDGKPIGGEYPDYVEARDLFESVHDYLDIEIDGIPVSLLHYPMESWNYRHGRTIHLHGHNHGTMHEKYNRLDVGIDNYYILYKDYKPFSWDEVLINLKRINENFTFSERH